MISIAIDGPAGAGKSSTAKALSKRLGFGYFDTGALYRAIAYYFIKNNLDYKDIMVIIKEINNIKIGFKFNNGNQLMYLFGNNITNDIRTDNVSMVASAVSAFPEVRNFLLEMQRKVAYENNIVMDGRDIGTVVLPKATVKIFLTANIKVRAERRFNELKRKGIEITYDDVLLSVEKRDTDDMNRSTAPLTVADDAIIFDTTEYTQKEVVDILYKLVKERIS